ncbi:DUF6199 family natural product biosynthesis protein [Cohnella cholangitidis]|uniref:DUF6199 domain-containing protein n=1 Tax=Cohnella cholangitidis TaxID=2598458 RepID=A0A7G5BYK8_9BACL|nr:DUF6199 family natural product biosynthesis protein [Cohnella cholangitidis]QMV42042.1 hypothetical protein FPL14_13170 [Cohnella cholangitidis]
MILFTLIPILFIILGAIGVFFPRVSWYMGVGWQFKNAEPSTAALISARIGGILAIIVGIFLLASGILPS